MNITHFREYSQKCGIFPGLKITIKKIPGLFKVFQDRTKPLVTKKRHTSVTSNNFLEHANGPALITHSQQQQHP